MYHDPQDRRMESVNKPEEALVGNEIVESVKFRGRLASGVTGLCVLGLEYS